MEEIKHYLWRNLIILAPIILITFLSINLTGYAVPAEPRSYMIQLSDGTWVEATKWGDERGHGWVTRDGRVLYKEGNKFFVASEFSVFTQGHRRGEL